MSNELKTALANLIAAVEAKDTGLTDSLDPKGAEMQAARAALKQADADPVIVVDEPIDIVPEPPAPMTTTDRDQLVSQKLQAARAAHLSYRYALKDNPQQARAELLNAQTQRLAAQALDPFHEALAWKSDALTHPNQDLLAFYAKELAK